MATFWPEAMNLSRLSSPWTTNTNEPVMSSQPSPADCVEYRGRVGGLGGVESTHHHCHNRLLGHHLELRLEDAIPGLVCELPDNLATDTVAAHPAHQLPAERGGGVLTAALGQRRIGGREVEQGATHRHPPHRSFPVVHRRGDFVERGLGTSGEDNRYTVAGSVACRAIREASTSSGPAASPRRWWRLTIEFRRSWVEIVRTLPP